MWTNDLELMFLECYQQEAVLWDSKIRNHKDKTKLHEAWHRISTIMSIPTEELKRKKDSLMATYRMHCRKIQASLHSGANSGDIYKPIWFAFEFMNSFLGERCANKIMNTRDNETKGLKNLEKRNETEKVKHEIQKINEIRKLSGQGDPVESTRVSQTPQTSTNRRRKNPPEFEEAGRNLREVLNILNNVLNKNQKQEDECDLFGKILAKKLRKLPEVERMQFMYEIDSLFIHLFKQINQ